MVSSVGRFRNNSKLQKKERKKESKKERKKERTSLASLNN